MRTPIVFAILAYLIVTGNTAQAVDKDQLREAASLPRLSLEFGFSLDSVNELINRNRDEASNDSPEKLLKAMTGTIDDVDRYDQLARHYHKHGKDQLVLQCRTKAIGLLRRHLAKQPNDAVALARLGTILPTEDRKEAEKLIRKAVKLAAGEAKCWDALVKFHEYPVIQMLFRLDGKTKIDLDKAAERLRALPLLPNQLQMVQDCIIEVFKCRDEAIRRNPENVQMYLKRVHSLVEWRAIHQSLLQRTALIRFPAHIDFPLMLDDLDKAARLESGNLQLWMVLGLAEAHSIGSANEGRKTSLWSIMSEQSKKRVRRCIAHLQAALNATDRKTTVIAARTLSWIYFELNDHEPAIAFARRVVQLTPADNGGWNELIGMMARSNHPDVLAMAQQWVNHKDCALSRYVLAKIYQHFDKNAKAEEQMRLALKNDPDDVHANLGLAVLLMRRSNDSDTSKEALKYVRRGNGQLTNDSPQKQRIDAIVITAIYYGLNAGGEDTARKLLRHVLSEDPQNASARKALDALQGP